MIRLDNFVHFPEFFFLKVVYFIFKVCTFSSCLLLHVCGPCQITSLQIQTKKWNVDFTHCWNKDRPGSYLVNKLETEVYSDLSWDFEAFSSVSFTSFFAGYNCPQQLYIKQKQTIFQSYLVCFSNRLRKARPGSSLAFQTKIAISSDPVG